MNILSFDCANRSLAVCYLTINTNIIHDIYDAVNTATLNIAKLKLLTDQYVKIHIMKVYDITGTAKKVSACDRTSALCKHLKLIDGVIAGNNPQVNKIDLVLIEYQMPLNDKTRCMSFQIMYHYKMMHPAAMVVFVGPTLKNKVCFAPHLTYGDFAAKYKSKYAANKHHTTANMLHWLDIFGYRDILQSNGIKKVNYDDIADAFIQIFGWLQYGDTEQLLE
jgi:hypothetical protein